MAKKNGNGTDEPLEKQLWKSADKLRKNIDAAEYKHVVLGLIFLKYISDAFEELYDKLKKGKGEYEGADPEDKDEYKAENVFFVPPSARWRFLQSHAKQPTIGKTVDESMDAIERENPSLKGVLPKVYARQNLDPTSLGELIDLIGNIALGDAKSRSADILGHVFEYFLGEFALAEGKKGGQFYTPRSVVELLVEMLQPYKGRVFDPCCGSGGMFVQSEKFVTEHQGKINDISIYGQESNQTTWRLAKMNLAIRGIDSSQVKWNNEGSFLNDAHKDLKCDFIIANPPFNVSDWSGDLLRKDGRWQFGTPPAGNANFAWVQHFMYHLAPQGKAGFVLSNGSLSSNSGGEGEIRKNIIDADLVECIVMLPKQLFLNTGIPACLWFLNRKKNRNQKEILFIDASDMGFLVNRKNREFSSEDIKKLAGLYEAWKIKENYNDIEGLCYNANLDEVKNQNYILTPSRYVGNKKSDFNLLSSIDELKYVNEHTNNFSQNSQLYNSQVTIQLKKYCSQINWHENQLFSIEALKTISKVLYKQWFVEYDFPNEHNLPYKKNGGKINQSAIGDLPQNWTITALGDLCEKISKGTTPTKTETTGLTEDVPFLKVKDISDEGEINFLNIEYIPEEVHLTSLKRSILETNDILFSIAGTIGRVTILPEKLNQCNCNQAIAFVRLNDKELFLEYITLWFQSEITQYKIKSNIVQGVQANVSLGVLSDLQIIVPPKIILDKWKELISPIFNMIQFLKKDRMELLADTSKS
jgi:type I restriction enzyme M protein